MKKNLMMMGLALVAGLCCPVVLSSCGDSIVPAEAKVKPTDRATAAKGMLACMKVVNETLDSVKDKDSADKAAKRLEPLRTAFKELSTASNALPTPSPQELEEVSAIGRQVFKEIGDIMNKLNQMNPPYYGSTALKEMLGTNWL